MHELLHIIFDTQGAEVAEYDRNGLRVRSFDNSGGLFERPACCLTLDLDGYVLVADWINDFVALLNSSLELVRVFSRMNTPVGLCYRPQTRQLFVTMGYGDVNVYSVGDWISLTTRCGEIYSEQNQSRTVLRRAVRSSSWYSCMLLPTRPAGGRFDTSTQKEPSSAGKAMQSDAHSDYSSSHSIPSSSRKRMMRQTNPFSAGKAMQSDAHSDYSSSHSIPSSSRKRMMRQTNPFSAGKATQSDAHSDYSSSHSTNTAESSKEHILPILVGPTAGVDREEHFEAADTGSD
jgi:hypothetical protein